MYLMTFLIAVFSYFFLKLFILYKKPKEWKGIKSVSLLQEVYKTYLNPLPYDISFDKYILPFLNDLGMVTVCSLVKGHVLLVTNPESLKEIFKNTDTFFKEPLSMKNDTLSQEHLGAEQVVSANGEDWKRMRKVMNPMFRQSWKPELFGSCFSEVIEEWDKLEGKAILIHDHIQRMTLDVLGRAFFDFDFKAVKNPNTEIYNLYCDVSFGVSKDAIYSAFPILDCIPFLRRYALHEKVEKYNKFVDDLIKRRKQEILDGKAQNNLLTNLIQASISPDEKEAVLTDRELRDNLKIFFAAGHDTTANTLTSIIYYLARYPEIQAKLRSEIIEIMGESDSVRVPTVDEVKKMEYLSMIIKESIRCVTTASDGERRAVKPFTFSNGVKVPEGRIVTIHLWGLFHNPKYFPEPYKFDPERFRDPNCEANKNWIPFITGPRTCIGMSFSLMEQKVTLAMLIQAYTFQVSPENPNYEKLRIVTFGLPHPDDFKVCMVRRVKN